MRNLNSIRSHARRGATVALAVFAAVLLFETTAIRAAVWNGIEPLKSRRADVERALGRPIEDKAGQTGTLRFNVAGGMVTVSFVTAKFIATKKLSPELEGTVLQVVLQHDRANDTPESLKLINNSDFEREDKGQITVFRNQKNGLAYTFLGGKLKTTWFSSPAEQLVRAQVKG